MRVSARVVGLALFAAVGLTAPLVVAGPVLAAPENPTCFGQTPTITGTDGDDILRGTPADDVIVGLAGNDRIRGKGGNDLICGAWDEGGSDSVGGELANDTLYGGPGDDKLLGTESDSMPGNGWATGGKGADLFKNTGVTYEDALHGVTVSLEEGTARGRGKDTLENIVNLKGSSFNDDLTGNAEGVGIEEEDCGCDFISGLRGDDVIRALKGWDDIHGGLGDDELYGGKGHDDLAPGRGTDLVKGGRSLNDLVTYFSDDAPVTIDLVEGVARGRGHDTLKGIEHAGGTRFADEIWGDEQRNVLSGAAGRDELHGRQGRDTLFGAEGDDTLFGGKGRDLGIGQAGHDVCHTEGEKSCEE